MNKNIQMKQRNGTNWDKLYPLSLIDNVFDNDGVTPLRNFLKANPVLNVKDFGAKGDGVKDDTQAIQACLNIGGVIFFPTGRYIVTSKLTIIHGDTQILGSGINQAHFNTTGTIIISRVPTPGITIEIPPYRNNVIIRDLMITRDVEATNNVVGIKISMSDFYLLENVYISNHGIGFDLRGSSFATVRQCVASTNYASGFRVMNGEDLAPCQIDFLDCYAEKNDGYGFLFYAVKNMPVGSFINNKTFANKTGGVWYLGQPNAKINGVRITGGFFGEDGSHVIYLSHCGFPVIITGAYVELAGEGGCGRHVATPPPRYGSNIFIDNCKNTTITGCAICNSAYSGITATSEVNITGNVFSQCGIENIAGNNAGVSIMDTCLSSQILSNQFDSAYTGIILNGDRDILVMQNDLKRVVTPFYAGSVLTKPKIKFNIGLANNV